MNKEKTTNHHAIALLENIGLTESVALLSAMAHEQAKQNDDDELASTSAILFRFAKGLGKEE